MDGVPIVAQLAPTDVVMCADYDPAMLEGATCWSHWRWQVVPSSPARTTTPRRLRPPQPAPSLRPSPIRPSPRPLRRHVGPDHNVRPRRPAGRGSRSRLARGLPLGRGASQDPFNAEKEQAALDRRLGVIPENPSATLADYRARNYAIRADGTSSRPRGDGSKGRRRSSARTTGRRRGSVCEVNSWIWSRWERDPVGTMPW